MADNLIDERVQTNTMSIFPLVILSTILFIPGMIFAFIWYHIWFRKKRQPIRIIFLVSSIVLLIYILFSKFIWNPFNNFEFTRNNILFVYLYINFYIRNYLWFFN